MKNNKNGIFTKTEQMETLSTQIVENERVIIRVDFNVPLDKEGNVLDATRIIAAKPTIDFIRSKGASCVLLSHLGRPKGVTPTLSQKQIVPKVSEVLALPVQFCNSCIGYEAESAVASLQPGEVLLMENLRFYDEETSGDLAFSEALAQLGTFYVNDAFGSAHRAHASTTVMAQFFNGKKCFGKLMEQEIKAIKKVMETGEKPVLAILGGAKVSSKITIIESMMDKIDHLIIGGGMVYTFIKAKGGKIGNSICEYDYQDVALEILEKAKAKGVQIHLPMDVVCGDVFSNDANKMIAAVDNIEDGWQGMDAGPKSIEHFTAVVQRCQTILWNGPLGVFEFSNFAFGTIALGEAIASQTSKGSFSLVGGGDSVSAVKQFGLEAKMSYVSTGGGAMLESLEGKTLPGIAALLD